MKTKIILAIIFMVYLIPYQSISQTWNLNKKIVANQRFEDDYFGRAVSISGDFAIVGAPYHDYDESGNNYLEEAGAVYVYKNTNGSWNFYQKLVSPNRAFGEYFGSTLSIYGDYIMIATTNNSYDQNGNNYLFNAGCACIFKKVNNTWTFQQKNCGI